MNCNCKSELGPDGFYHLGMCSIFNAQPVQIHQPVTANPPQDCPHKFGGLTGQNPDDCPLCGLSDKEARRIFMDQWTARNYDLVVEQVIDACKRVFNQPSIF